MLWFYLLAALAVLAAFAFYANRRGTRRSSRRTARPMTEASAEIGAPPEAIDMEKALEADRQAGVSRPLVSPPEQVSGEEKGTFKDRPLRKDNLSKEVELDWEASEVIEFQPGAYARPRDFKDEPTRSQLRKTGELGALDESSVLPSRYGKDRLVLMARDPRWVYAYWEIAHQKYHDMYQKHLHEWGLSRPVLRLYDLSPAPDQSREIDIALSDEADNWYVRVDRPDHTLVAEIGRLFADKFIPLARSNQVTLPPSSVSMAMPEEWSPLGWEAHYGRYAGDGAPSSPQRWGK